MRYLYLIECVAEESSAVVCARNEDEAKVTELYSGVYINGDESNLSGITVKLLGLADNVNFGVVCTSL